MRHLPQNTGLQELTRVFNRVQDEVERLTQSSTGSTRSSMVFSNAFSPLGVGSASSSVTVPAWVRSLNPPFAVLSCSNLGELSIDSDGCGILKTVLS